MLDLSRFDGSNDIFHYVNHPIILCGARGADRGVRLTRNNYNYKDIYVPIRRSIRVGGCTLPNAMRIMLLVNIIAQLLPFTFILSSGKNRFKMAD